MGDKCCLTCASYLYQSEAPIFFTCGHFICSGCSQGATCPIDSSQVIPKDEYVEAAVQQAKSLYAKYTQEPEVSQYSEEYTQLIQCLEAHLAATYKSPSCPQCGLLCSAEGCSNCTQAAGRLDQGIADSELKPLTQIMICPKCSKEMMGKCQQCGYIDLSLITTMVEESITFEVTSSAGLESAVSHVLLWTCNVCQYEYNKETSDSCERCQQKKQHLDQVLPQKTDDPAVPAAPAAPLTNAVANFLICSKCHYSNNPGKTICEMCGRSLELIESKKWVCLNCKYKYNTQKLVACASCRTNRPPS